MSQNETSLKIQNWDGLLFYPKFHEEAVWKRTLHCWSTRFHILSDVAIAPYCSSHCALSFQLSPDNYKDGSFIPRTDEPDIDVSQAQPVMKRTIVTEDVVSMCVRVFVCQTKLSRLCEQDKAVRMQEEKLQQLHREKVRPLVFLMAFLRGLTCAGISQCFCVRVCHGSIHWKRPCCPPVRSWVNRAAPMLWPFRVWSSRGTCCRTACSAPAESCPESALWARPHTCNTTEQVALIRRKTIRGTYCGLVSC